MRHQHSHPMHGPGGAQIDLHWRPLWEPATTGHMWSRMSDGFVGGVPTLVPSVADQIVVACAHGVGWYPSPLRWIPDTAMLARHSSDQMWGDVIVAARERRLSGTTAASLTLVADVTGLHVPADVIDRLVADRGSLIERIAGAHKLRGGATASRYVASFEYAARLRHDPDAPNEGPLHQFRGSRHVSYRGLAGELARGAVRVARRAASATPRGE